MVLRIEYILILVTAILLLSILGINPSSKPAINSTVDKEVLFKNFFLFELKVDSEGKKVFAQKAIKHTEYLDLREVNLSDENGHNILSTRAVYEDNAVFMKDDIKFTRNDGLTFTTKDLSYDFKSEEVETFSPFLLEFHGSTIEGDNLEYNMKNKEISADDIVASIITATLP
jgi:hypothetical protein